MKANTSLKPLIINPHFMTYLIQLLTEQRTMIFQEEFFSGISPVI